MLKQFGLVTMTTAIASMTGAFPAEADENLQARGLLKSAARVEVRTDLAAKVRTAPFQEGMRFSKGELLIEFGCERYSAEVNSAKAAARAAGIESRNAKQLYNNGAAGKAEWQLASARAARAAADVKVRTARMEDCLITAPFSGRVVEMNVRAHEMPKPDRPVIVLIDDSSLELELVVASNWLTWLKPGAAFAFEIDETATNHQAEVTRLGAEVDPVSQTIKVFGRLDGDLTAVLAGMSGTAQFAGPEG